MTIRLFLVAIAALACAAGPARAEDGAEDDAAGIHSFARLDGVWVSPDGAARTSFELDAETGWVTTRMWFGSEDDWTLVAHGGAWTDPEDGAIEAVSRARMMDGFIFFESTVEVREEGLYWSNIAWREDGESMESFEQWTWPEDGRWSYEIWSGEGEDREVWYQGVWQRADQE